MQTTDGMPLLRPRRSSRRLSAVPSIQRHTSQSPDGGHASNRTTPQPGPVVTGSNDIADISDETQRAKSSSSTTRAPSVAEQLVQRHYRHYDEVDDASSSSMSSRRTRHTAAPQDHVAAPRYPDNDPEASGRRSVSSGAYFGSSSSARIAAALENAQKMPLSRPASQMQLRGASRTSHNNDQYGAPAPVSARRTLNRSYERHLDMERISGDTSFESDASFHQQRDTSAGLSRARADLLLMKTPPAEERVRPSSRATLSRASERYALDPAMSSARYSSEQAARQRQTSASAVHTRQALDNRNYSAEHSPLDALRERRTVHNLRAQAAGTSPQDTLRPNSRANRQRRALGRDVFDDVPPLPSSSRHPLSPVYDSMELTDGSRAASARQREASAARGRASVLDDVRARIDDLTGSRSFSRASSRFSRDPSYYSSTPSHSHATSSATSIHPSTEPRHKPRSSLSHAIQEDVPEGPRSSSVLRREVQGRYTMGRASAFAERTPVTPDTSHIVQRQRSFYTTPASTSVARPSSRPSLPLTSKDAGTPLHSRNLLSSLDAFERHYLGLVDMDVAQKTMPMQADMVSRFQEAAQLALDMNSELRSIVQQNLDNQIDAEISNAQTKQGITYVEAFAQMDKSLGGLVRRSDEHVRRLTEGLMLLTRVDNGTGLAPVAGMTTSRSDDVVGARTYGRHARAITSQGTYMSTQRIEPRHTSLETRRSVQQLRSARDARYASSSQAPSDVSTSSVSAGSRVRVSSTTALRPPGGRLSPSDATRGTMLAPSPTFTTTTAATTTTRNKLRSVTNAGSIDSPHAAAAGVSPGNRSRRSTLSTHSMSRTASTPSLSEQGRAPGRAYTQLKQQAEPVDGGDAFEQKTEDTLEMITTSSTSNLSAERPKEQASNTSLRTVVASQALPMSPNKGSLVPASVSSVNVAQQASHASLQSHLDLADSTEGLMLDTGHEASEDQPQDDVTFIEHAAMSPRPSIDRSISLDSVDSLHSNRSGPPPSAWRGTVARKQSTPPVVPSTLINASDLVPADVTRPQTAMGHDGSAPLTPARARNPSESSVSPITAQAATMSSLDLVMSRRQGSDATYDTALLHSNESMSLSHDWVGNAANSSSSHPQRSASVASVGLARSLGRHAGLSVRDRIKALESSKAAVAAAASESIGSPTSIRQHTN